MDGIAGVDNANLEDLKVCPGAGQNTQTQRLDPVFGRWGAEGMRRSR